MTEDELDKIDHVLDVFATDYPAEMSEREATRLFDSVCRILDDLDSAEETIKEHERQIDEMERLLVGFHDRYHQGPARFCREDPCISLKAVSAA